MTPQDPNDQKDPRFRRENWVQVAVVASFLVSLILVTALPSFPLTGDNFGSWLGGYLQNASTEFLGAFMTYIIFDRVVNQREKRREREIQQYEQEKRREEELRDKKEKILQRLSSRISGFASSAIEELKVDTQLKEMNPLVGADLSGADLSNADFSELDLSEIKLVGANLTGAKFQHAKLDNADLSKADLTNAEFLNVTVCGAVFDACNLKDVRFDQVDMTDASLRSATLTGIKFNATTISNVILPNSDVFNSSLGHSVEDLKEFTAAPTLGRDSFRRSRE